MVMARPAGEINLKPSKLTPDEFRRWRKSMGWKREETAERLGISLASIVNYENGKRSDKNYPVQIPYIVALGCAALEKGLEPLAQAQ